VGSVSCHACQGTGRKATGKRLEVTIPRGVENGTKIRLRGKGGQGRAGGPPGDVVLEVDVAEDGRLTRRRSALHTDVAVPLTTAVLGGEVSVLTVTGQVVLQIPEGTQNGRVFRLAGQGMPTMKSEQAGDLFAKVRVVLPEQLDDARRELFQQLRSLESIAPIETVDPPDPDGPAGSAQSRGA
jgi:DnaJ-class molecular chaperone